MAKKKKKYTKTYVDRLRTKIATLEEALIQKYDSITERYCGANKNTRKNKDRKKFWINTILAIATVVIAAFAVAQYFSFKKFTRKTNRAYLVAIVPELNLLQIGEQIEVSYTVRNDGQTPAYNVRDSVFVKILPDTSKPKMPTDTRDFYYPLYGSGIPQIREVHSAKQIYTQKLKIALNDTVNTHGIYLWGRIKYTDIFKKPHWTTFCYRYVWHKPIGAFRTYGTCNDADRN